MVRICWSIISKNICVLENDLFVSWDGCTSSRRRLLDEPWSFSSACTIGVWFISHDMACCFWECMSIPWPICQSVFVSEMMIKVGVHTCLALPLYKCVLMAMRI
jgi:hypothetical protein